MGKKKKPPYGRVLAGLLLAFIPACASPASLPTDGVVGKLVGRVVLRHDAYVAQDAALAESARAQALDESQELRMLILLPEVGKEALGFALEPVLSRHDAYVRYDAELDPLARDVYIESSDRLRSLVGMEQPIAP